MTRTAMQAISRRPRAYSPETACLQPMPPTAIRRSILIEGRSTRPFLLPPRFHGAPGVEAARRHRGENSRANNELAGAPGRIRTSDPQIRSLKFKTGLGMIGLELFEFHCIFEQTLSH